MSKMDEFNLELQEQAEELGFETTEEALNAGYEVDMEAMGQGVARLCIDREQEQAHEAWLKERDGVIESLNNAIYHNYKLNNNKNTYEQIVMRRARDFIKKGE